jgi:hypothetical protein
LYRTVPLFCNTPVSLTCTVREYFD